ncbi:MAG: hypothetical protein IT480_06445 [Gammaproteobacteria bacterium]|nr:hypothetical protein [Gammaproteobacteria bacterium]
MLPDHVLSTYARTAAFLPPRDGIRNPLVDYHWGGIALNDASQGMRVQVWTIEYLPDQMPAP